MTGLRAAVTLGLTGRYAVQARDARVGLELWVEDDHVGLHVDDDAGSPAVALAAYRTFLAGDFDILLGPYSSGLVRRVVATAYASGDTPSLFHSQGQPARTASRAGWPVSWLRGRCTGRCTCRVVEPAAELPAQAA